MKHILKFIEDKINFLTIIIVITTFIFLIFPFIIYGEDSIITIHDNLDQFIGYYRFFKTNNLFFTFNNITTTLGGMPTLYYTYAASYNLNSLIYLIFETFSAYLITYIIQLIIGFVSMYLLLKHIFKEKNNFYVLTLVSLSFAILPKIPFWQLGSASLPLVIYLFLIIFNSNSKKIDFKVILMVFYPLVSYFVINGIFILPLWFIGLLYNAFKEKKFNVNLFLGFVFLSIGYVLVDFQLFYYVLTISEPLNRTIFNDVANIRVFIVKVYSYIFVGQYHGTTFQNLFILPLMVFGLISINLGIYNIKDRSKTFNYLAIFFVLFSILSSLYDSRLISSYLNSIFPFLAGINWGRIYFFNQVILYVLFAMVLLHINNQKIQWRKTIVFIFLIFQLGYILINPVFYNDSIKNVFHEFFLDREDTLTYSEFYSEDLFYEIKQKINYSDEISLAFGFHPSVLMYNNINSLDGYMNSYPLEYMVSFRKLLQPEFETNYRDRDYFDSWGGRLYLYNSTVSFQPTRNIPDEEVELKIDIDYFMQLNGKYIFSLYRFSNAKELNLILSGAFNDESSLYTIYVYEVEYTRIEEN